MKYLISLFLWMYGGTIFGQLKPSKPVCPGFSVDILEGIINNSITTKSTVGQVKIFFPCYTESVEESTPTKCRGLYYADKDIYFFNDRGYIEIREKFKGDLIPKLLGANRGSLFSTLGNPKIRDNAWDAFQTKYGILILYYNKANKINKIQISYKTTDSIKLCE